MMQLVWDLLIWLCLAIGVCFGGLGFFGLLIFPDIRSRMFTAVRASLIGISAITVAVILFGINGYLVTGGSQYLTLIIHILFFYGVILVADVSISRIILERTLPGCPADPKTGAEPVPEKKE